MNPRVAVYLRVSTEQQSYESQRVELEEYGDVSQPKKKNLMNPKLSRYRSSQKYPSPPWLRFLSKVQHTWIRRGLMHPYAWRRGGKWIGAPIRDWITLRNYSLRRSLMKPELIPDLLDQLQRQPTSECVRNPYRSTAAVENLRAYLSLLCGYPYSGHLLVEAYPLSWNCIRTGIPNSSEEILGSGVHPFLSKLLPSLKLSGDSAEQLSSISWKAFAKRKTVPAFWYIFPYHSHAPENKEEGRFPTDRELSGSLALLHLAVQVLSPHTIVTFEGEAEAIVRSEFPYLKHRTFPPRAEGVQRFFANCESLGIP